MRRRILAAVLVACTAISGGGAQRSQSAPLRHAGATLLVVHPGEDWWLPTWVRPSPNSGLFSETAAPALHVDVRSIDLSWRQLEPRRHVLDSHRAGMAEGMTLPSLAAGLAGRRPFWMRIFASGVSWAPRWVVRECHPALLGPDYEGRRHLALWNPCVWRELMWLYKRLYVTRGLRNDPRLRFVYVPGAFTWAEFDFDMVRDAYLHHGLRFRAFNRWFQSGMQELVTIFGPQAHKLVYTGEDYPYGPFGARENLLARDAVAKGMGIRTGITEVYNDHLSQVPAYGTTIGQDGHLHTNDAWQLFSGGRIAATENECFNDCGFHAKDLAYDVRLANLKALQLRMNWIYVVPGPSYLRRFPAQWEWTRLELGKTARSTPDAWAVLRDAQDLYWRDNASHPWPRRPWVRNLERFLVQRDVAPDGVARRGTDLHRGDPAPDNGTAYEGLRTDLAHGQDALYFDLDNRIAHGTVMPVRLQVTYRDVGLGAWHAEYTTLAGTAQAPPVQLTNTGAWRTAIFELDDAAFTGALAGGCDFRLVATGGSDLEARFVRVIRLQQPLG